MTQRETAPLRRNLSRSGRHTLAGDVLAGKILEGARKVMIEQGAGGFSVRKVASEAGVSLGHLQHYFPTRSELLTAMVIALEEDFYNHFTATISLVEDPVERFVACAEYVLTRGANEDLLPLMREFWAMAARDDGMADSLRAFYEACRDFAAKILRKANDTLDQREAQRRSCAAVSALSGSFLYLHPWRGDTGQVEFRNYLLEMMRSLPFDANTDALRTA